MKRFMAFAASALTLSALLGLATTSSAQNHQLQLRRPAAPPATNVIGPPPDGGAVVPDPTVPGTGLDSFNLDLFYIPDANQQGTANRTSTVQTYVLYDVNKFGDVIFTPTLNAAAAAGGPSTAQKNLLAPTNKTISVVPVSGPRQLSSFNTPVDILGSNPTGNLSTLVLLDGSIQGANTAGLQFPAGGFRLGTYTFTFKTNTDGDAYAGNFGNTVIGIAENLIGAGQTLSDTEKTTVALGTGARVPVTTSGVYRFNVVPAPSSVAIMAMGGLMPLVAIARRRRAAK